MKHTSSAFSVKVTEDKETPKYDYNVGDRYKYGGHGGRIEGLMRWLRLGVTRCSDLD